MPPRTGIRFCLNCKKEIFSKNGKYNKVFCSLNCQFKYYVGKNHPCWKGGEYQDGAGYIHVWSPNHPNKSSIGYVKRARLVLEKCLGRYLRKDEITHHKNKIKDDDRVENLSILTSSNHSKLHQKEDKLYKHIAISRFKIVKILPVCNIENEILSLLPEYRTFITSKCSKCGKLFWCRKDHKAKTCSQSCNIKLQWETGGFDNRKKRCLK